MKVTVSMVSTKHADVKLRTNTFTGTLIKKPKIGERLVITGRGLSDRKLVRHFETSLITDIVKVGPKIQHIHTQFSIYKLVRVDSKK